LAFPIGLLKVLATASETPGALGKDVAALSR
jgi:hypothetical protein